MIRKRMAMVLWTMLLATGAAVKAQSTEDAVFGNWTEPGGSTIRVEKCDDGICAVLTGIGKSTPYTVDGQNPDPAMRTRPLCGLHIGTGFTLDKPGHLEGGRLYDPKSGKTYKGSIEAEGNTLKLRGYVGAKIFGRSETWTRATAPGNCPAHARAAGA